MFFIQLMTFLSLIFLSLRPAVLFRLSVPSLQLPSALFAADFSFSILACSRGWKYLFNANSNRTARGAPPEIVSHKRHRTFSAFLMRRAARFNWRFPVTSSAPCSPDSSCPPSFTPSSVPFPIKCQDVPRQSNRSNSPCPDVSIFPGSQKPISVGHANEHSSPYRHSSGCLQVIISRLCTA